MSFSSMFSSDFFQSGSIPPSQDDRNGREKDQGTKKDHKKYVYTEQNVQVRRCRKSGCSRSHKVNTMLRKLLEVDCKDEGACVELDIKSRKNDDQAKRVFIKGRLYLSEPAKSDGEDNEQLGKNVAKRIETVIQVPVKYEKQSPPCEVPIIWESPRTVTYSPCPCTQLKPADKSGVDGRHPTPFSRSTPSKRSHVETQTTFLNISQDGSAQSMSKLDKSPNPDFQAYHEFVPREDSDSSFMSCESFFKSETDLEESQEARQCFPAVTVTRSITRSIVFSNGDVIVENSGKKTIELTPDPSDTAPSDDEDDTVEILFSNSDEIETAFDGKTNSKAVIRVKHTQHFDYPQVASREFVLKMPAIEEDSSLEPMSDEEDEPQPSGSSQDLDDIAVWRKVFKNGYNPLTWLYRNYSKTKTFVKEFAVSDKS